MSYLNPTPEEIKRSAEYQKDTMEFIFNSLANRPDDEHDERRVGKQFHTELGECTSNCRHWGCPEEPEDPDHDCHISPEDGCDCQNRIHKDDCPRFSDMSGATEGVER